MPSRLCGCRLVSDPGGNTSLLSPPKGGDEAAKAAAAAIEKKISIQADNIGHKLLSKMGWKEGEGLGK